MVLRSPRAILTSNLGRVRDAFSLCIVGYIYVVHSHILVEVKLLESTPVSEKFPGILLLLQDRLKGNEIKVISSNCSVQPSSRNMWVVEEMEDLKLQN